MLQIDRIQWSHKNKKCLLYVVKYSVLCLSGQKKYFFFCPCQKKLVLLHPLSRDSKPRWWNWQTRYFEGVVAVGRCKFKSCPGHRNEQRRLLFFTTKFQERELYQMPGWRNWQTRTFQVRVPKGVQVQVLFRAPREFYKQFKMNEMQNSFLFYISNLVMIWSYFEEFIKKGASIDAP